MFVDYYAVLEINSNSSQDAIKDAYKVQALKWHPDKNPDVDTTDRMQKINEAYLILKDSEARLLFDEEYKRYKVHQHQSYSNRKQQEETNQSHESQAPSKPFEDINYQIVDETLKKWIANAKRQAVSLAKQTIDDIQGMSKASGKAIGEAALNGFFRYVVFGIILIVVFRACK
jgi:curved DNA-binding protein CbpA